MPTMGLDQKQVRHGSRDPTSSIIEQAGATVQIALGHREKLLGAGLEPDWYDKTRELIARVSAARGTQIASRDGAKNLTCAERGLCADGRSLIRQIKTAAQLVLRDGPVDGVRLSSFMMGPVGRTTSGVMDYMARLRPQVANLEEPLKRYFKGRSPTALLDHVLDHLREIASTQEARHSSAPLETLALYEAQGALLRQLEQVNLVARIAFDDDPALRALFNKRILMRGRGRRRKQAEQAEQTEPAEEKPQDATQDPASAD
jgi:hypothetical protein